jgi:hypothetical protein
MAARTVLQVVADLRMSSGLIVASVGMPGCPTEHNRAAQVQLVRTPKRPLTPGVVFSTLLQVVGRRIDQAVQGLPGCSGGGSSQRDGDPPHGRLSAACAQ